MESFWDFSVWGTFNLFAVLLGSLLVGNVLQKTIPLLRRSLIPTSVIGGIILILVAAVYKAVTGQVMFDTAFFGSNGTETLEVITYHTLALGFIASTLKGSEGKMGKKRTGEIFNTGVTTVATYLMQASVGFIITMVAAKVVPGFFPASGILLALGYGQGTGQALNYGTIYETDFGFVGGKSFGLTIAALGFLSACIGGVIHMNIMRRRGKLTLADPARTGTAQHQVDGENEIPLSESIDKMTVQISLIAVCYLLAYLVMYLLGCLLPGMRSVVYGFNFLIGVLSAILVKNVLKFLKKKDIIQREYTNNFLLTRAGNFCFDLMIVAGVAAIRLDILENYWGIILILGLVGTAITYIYNRFVARTLFPEYEQEQFLMMYGMLTGTASTGTILLREVDSEFKTPASDNMVYQNLPAIAFGFPMMLLITMAPVRPALVLAIFLAYFAAMNVILFRKQIFKKG